ncbi:hypothetical protein N0V84_002191 [Fusarium piperis]|uniref:Aminoglycoside phosphotransferase domain-containing protein n=1 Tax=Fusarium piperis TaxID=1435070 RepID=A0A9W8WK52_9HYPO|nr:hypothetical protein N0V84_002191 [Fusarium piperis]
MSTLSRKGLFWEHSGIDLEPQWESEPRIEAIQSVCCDLFETDALDDFTVSFLSSGALNKVYIVEYKVQKKKFVFRVSLPVDPQYKTAGEVATLSWLELNTTIPSPRVHAFQYSSENKIGYEWIMMDLMPGASAYHRWRKMSMMAKTRLVETIARYQAELINSSEFRAIGTLQNFDLRRGAERPPGRIVSLIFCWGKNFHYNIPRGPFRSSHDWLKAFISVIIQEKASEINEAEDEEDRDCAKSALKVALMLDGLLPKIFPRIQNPPERTILWHDDLSLENIMVNEEGEVTAIIDWECVSAMPLWVTTQIPDFLVGPDREEEPCREKYADKAPEDESESEDIDQGKCEIYWDHLMEYEQTQLRKVWMDRMARGRRGWTESMSEDVLKVDFHEAVIRCAGGSFLMEIKEWIDGVDRGEFPRLAKCIA